jgi:hypothetical protein
MRSGRARGSVRVAAASLLAALLLPAVALAQASADNVTPLGIGPEYCLDQGDEPPLSLPALTYCQKLKVRCAGAAPRVVFLRVTRPSPPSSLRGTVVLGLGGRGTKWYVSAANGVDLLVDLGAAGFRVIQRAWEAPDGPDSGGWLEDSTSLHNSSCRYASLIDWIHANPRLFDPETALCASGNSSGAAEISYALSTWGMETLLDLAVPTAGPPMGSVREGCLGEPDDPSDPLFPQQQAWSDACARLRRGAGICPPGAGLPRCFYSELEPDQVSDFVDAAFNLNDPPDDTPCRSRDEQVLRNNSVLFPGADLDYPQTKVHFILGVDDCGSAVPLGLTYIRQVQGQTTGEFDLDVVIDTGHTVPDFPNGYRAIANAIDNPDGCVPRH